VGTSFPIAIYKQGPGYIEIIKNYLKKFKNKKCNLPRIWFFKLQEGFENYENGKLVAYKLQYYRTFLSVAESDKLLDDGQSERIIIWFIIKQDYTTKTMY